MASFNKVILLGNLVKAPELKTLPNTSICKFTLAVNSTTKSNKSTGEVTYEVSFFDITVFGKQAENCNQYLDKGSSVIVDGRLQQRRWESQDGQKRSKVEVVAQSVTFMPKSEKKDNDPAAYHAPKPVEDVPF